MKHISTFWAVIFILVIGFVGTGLLYGYERWVGPESHLLGGEYVAAFLSTNEVYFGKISSISDEYVIMRDVYYPRANDAANTDINQPNILLVKTGNELHGPQDEMFLSRNHVVLLQPLRSDSQVVQTIASYEASQ